MKGPPRRNAKITVARRSKGFPVARINGVEFVLDTQLKQLREAGNPRNTFDFGGGDLEDDGGGEEDE